MSNGGMTVYISVSLLFLKLEMVGYEILTTENHLWGLHKCFDIQDKATVPQIWLSGLQVRTERSRDKK